MPATPLTSPDTTDLSTTYVVTVSSVDQHGDPGYPLARGEFFYLRRACEFSGEQAHVVSRMRELSTVWVEVTEQSPDTEQREVMAVRAVPSAVTAAALRVLADPRTPVRVIA